MAKVLVVPEDVNMFDVQLKKGEYTPDQLKGFKSQAIANLVSRTAAHWKIKEPAKAKAKSAAAAE